MSPITDFVGYLMSFVERLGYVGIFAIISLEYACFPIPSEIVLPFVGMSIPQTSLSFLPGFLVSIVAGLTGSWLCYWIGSCGGQPLLHKLSSRFGGLKKALTSFNSWFDAYGRWAVLFIRVVPLTRTYISLFAGVNAMPFWEFTLYSSVGIAAWNLLLMSLGFYLGNNWPLIQGLLNTYSHIIITLLVLLGTAIVCRKIFATKKKSV